MTNVALVPGVLGFERFGPVHYFNGVASHLEQTFPGLKVREMSTNPIGTVANRADVLAREIVEAFGPSEPVHLVAHSMGGLDARWLVAKNIGGVGQRVKTLVSISTPHLGSPVATAVEAGSPLDLLPGLLNTSAFFAPTFLFVHAIAGRNDGVVPMTSALRGRTPFAIWAGDHADLIGHDLDSPLRTPAFDYLRAYEHIITAGILA